MDLFVGDFMDARGGVLVQALDGRVVQQVNVPAYGGLDFTQAFKDEVGTAAGGNSVRLVDATHAGMPLHRAVVNKPYRIELAGFPAFTPLTVSMVGSDATGETQTVAVVKRLVTTDKAGSAAFEWKVPAGQPTGDYYLKASDISGKVFGLSTSFEVAATARRRLVGPSFEVWH